MCSKKNNKKQKMKKKLIKIKKKNEKKEKKKYRAHSFVFSPWLGLSLRNIKLLQLKCQHQLFLL